MKKIKEIYKPYMIRPIIYSTFTKFMSSLCVVLLWDRFVNSRNVQPYGVVDFAFFITAVYFILWAWLQYLVLDGLNLEVFKSLAEMVKPKKKVHYTRDFVDFVDEKVVTFDSLDDDEQIVAKILSNLTTSACFLIPSLIATFL